MSSIPGNDYFDFENNRWRDGSSVNWAENHQINQETGELEGDYPLPPADVARGYQAMHDRAVWNYRRRLMDQGRSQIADGTNYNKGALGLLQSFRSGGGAALEAGVYNQVAGGKRAEGAASFQQASMTQPLDLQSDLRRHDATIAQRKADRANERAMVTTLVGGLLGGTVSSSASGQQSPGGSTQSYRASASGESGQTFSGPSSDSSQMQGYSANLADPELTGGQPQAGPGQQQSQQSPFAGTGAGTGGGTGLMAPENGGFNSEIQPFQQQAGGGVGAGGQGGRGDQQQQGGGMAGTTAAMGAPGADGNFSIESFAAGGASAVIDSPMAPLVMAGLSHFAADMYERDEFYQSLPAFIDNEWKKRNAR